MFTIILTHQVFDLICEFRQRKPQSLTKVLIDKQCRKKDGAKLERLRIYME